MKKRVLVGLVFVLIAALLLGVAAQTGAQAVRTEVSAYEYDCFTGFEEGGGVFEKGQGVTHVRGILHTNPNVSETPELNGLHHTVADAEFNANGNAVIRGTSKFEPYGIDGAWVGHWVVVYNNNRNSGTGVWRGTGALKGKMMFLEVYDAEPDGNLEAMCAGIGEPEGYVRVEGIMLETPLHPMQ